MPDKDDFNLMHEISKINPIELEGWLHSWDLWRTPCLFNTVLKLSAFGFLLYCFIGFLIDPHRYEPPPDPPVYTIEAPVQSSPSILDTINYERGY